MAAFTIAAVVTGCKDENVETVGLCPLVIATNPANAAVNVPLNQVITVTFNEAMNPATISPSAFSLSSPSGARVANPSKKASEIPGTLTYDDATHSMVFTPNVQLKANAIYTGNVATSVKDMAGNALQVAFVWTFATVAAPTVLSTDPIGNATSVPTNKVVRATFSVPMDPLTVTSTTFTVRQGTTAVAGVVSYTGSTASFTPSAVLLGSTIYTATITSGVKDVAGTSMTSNFQWTFNTGGSPTVILTDPLDLATGVLFDKVITAGFSEAMDPLTVTGSSFTLMIGAAAVSGAVTYSGTTATFTPGSPLLASTTYTATVTTGVKNVGGNPILANKVWSFTTAPTPSVLSTDPLNLANGVALNKVVGATFSGAMDALTITTTTFNLMNGATPVLGAVNYAGTTATFTPTANLLPGVTYTATITTGARNAQGVAMPSNHVWTFTTVNPIVPTVVSTDPLDLATGVPFNQVVGATFSEAMDPSTITGTTFTLKIGATPVAGVVNYSGTTATFTPTSNLLSGNTYTATVTAGAKSLLGVNMAADKVWTFSTNAPLGPPLVVLGSVARFGIIAGVGVSNDAGPSQINDMDVGISPGARTGITGFFDVDGGPGLINNGAFYASDDVAPPGTADMLIQAHADLVAAYDQAANATVPAPSVAPADLGGQTLAPGIWTSATTMLLQNGDLTLDAQGDANAVWIFQIGSAFTSVGTGPFPSPSGGNVILAGGAQAKNVFWQCGSSATIGDFTSFKGNILVLQTITMNSGAVAEGRMLARNGAVTMTSTNTINKP
jgi:hypothetical protein